MSNHTEITEEKHTSENKEAVIPEQPNLFGDQDFVYNVLQTELSDIDSEIEKTQESISRKKEKLEKLNERKQEVSKAAKIVSNQKKELEKKSKK